MNGSQVLAASEKFDYLFAHIFIKHSLMLMNVTELGKKTQEKSQRSIDQTGKG